MDRAPARSGGLFGRESLRVRASGLFGKIPLGNDDPHGRVLPGALPVRHIFS